MRYNCLELLTRKHGGAHSAAYRCFVVYIFATSGHLKLCKYFVFVCVCVFSCFSLQNKNINLCFVMICRFSIVFHCVIFLFSGPLFFSLRWFCYDNNARKTFKKKKKKKKENGNLFYMQNQIVKMSQTRKCAIQQTFLTKDNFFAYTATIFHVIL